MNVMANNGRILLSATVTDVGEGPFVYPACEHCYTKLTISRVQGCHLYRCHNCREVYNPGQNNYRYRLCLTITDSTTLANVTGFGGMLNSFFGVTATEFYNIYLSTAKGKFGAICESILQIAAEQVLVGQRLLFGLKTSRPDVGSLCAKDGGVTLKDICQTMDVLSQGPIVRNLSEFIAVQIVRQKDSASPLTVVECLHSLMTVLEENKITPNVCTDKTAILQLLNSCSRRGIQNVLISDNFTERCLSAPAGSSCDISFDSLIDQSSLQFTCDHSQEKIHRNPSLQVCGYQCPAVDIPLCTSNISVLSLDEPLKNTNSHLYGPEDKNIHSFCSEDKNIHLFCPENQNNISQSKENLEATEIVLSKQMLENEQMDYGQSSKIKSENVTNLTNKKKQSENQNLKELMIDNDKESVDRHELMHQNIFTQGCCSNFEVDYFEEKENNNQEWHRNKSINSINYSQLKDGKTCISQPGINLSRLKDGKTCISQPGINLSRLKDGKTCISQPGINLSRLKDGKTCISQPGINLSQLKDGKTCISQPGINLSRLKDGKTCISQPGINLSQLKDGKTCISQPGINLSRLKDGKTCISQSGTHFSFPAKRIRTSANHKETANMVVDKQVDNIAKDSPSCLASCVQFSLQSSPHKEGNKTPLSLNTYCKDHLQLNKENGIFRKGEGNCVNNQVSEFDVCGQDFLEDYPESEGLDLFLSQLSSNCVKDTEYAQINKSKNCISCSHIKYSPTAQKTAACKERQWDLNKQVDSDHGISICSKPSLKIVGHRTSRTENVADINFQTAFSNKNNRTREPGRGNLKFHKENTFVGESAENCMKDVSEFKMLEQEFSGEFMEDYSESEDIDVLLTQFSGNCDLPQKLQISKKKQASQNPDCEYKTHTYKNFIQNMGRRTSSLESNSLHQQFLEKVPPDQQKLPGFDRMSYEVKDDADRRELLFIKPLLSNDHQKKWTPSKNVGYSLNQVSSKNIDKQTKRKWLKFKSLMKQTLPQKLKISKKKQTSQNPKMLNHILQKSVNSVKNSHLINNAKVRMKQELSQNNVRNLTNHTLPQTVNNASKLYTDHQMSLSQACVSANQTSSQIVNASEKCNLNQSVNIQNKNNLLDSLRNLEKQMSPHSKQNANICHLFHNVGSSKIKILSLSGNNPKKHNLKHSINNLKKHCLSQNVNISKKQTLALNGKYSQKLNLAENVNLKQTLHKCINFQKKQNLSHHNVKKQYLHQIVNSSKKQTLLTDSNNSEKNILPQNVKNSDKQTLKLASNITTFDRRRNRLENESHLFSNVTLRRSKRKQNEKSVSAQDGGSSNEKIHCTNTIEEQTETENLNCQTFLVDTQNENDTDNCVLRPELIHFMDGVSDVNSVSCTKNVHVHSPSKPAKKVDLRTTDKLSTYLGNTFCTESSRMPQFLQKVKQKEITFVDSVNCEIFSDFEKMDRNLNNLTSSLTMESFPGISALSGVDDGITRSVDQLGCGKINITRQDIGICKQNGLVTEKCKQNVPIVDTCPQSYASSIFNQRGYIAEVCEKKKHTSEISKEKEYATQISKEKQHVKEISKEEHVTEISKEKEHVKEISKKKEHVTEISKEKEHATEFSKEKEHVTEISKKKEHVTEISKKKEHVTEISKEKEHVTEISKEKEHVTEISKKKEHVTEISKEKEHATQISKEKECVIEISKEEHVTEISKEKEHVTEIIENYMKASISLEELKKLEFSVDVPCHNEVMNTCTEDLIDRWQNTGHFKNLDAAMTHSSQEDDEHDSDLWCQPPTPQNPLITKYKFGKSVGVLRPSKMLSYSNKCERMLQDDEEIQQDFLDGSENSEFNNGSSEHLVLECSHHSQKVGEHFVSETVHNKVNEHSLSGSSYSDGVGEYLLSGGSHFNRASELLMSGNLHNNEVSEHLLSDSSQDLFSSDDDSLLPTMHDLPVNSHNQTDKFDTAVPGPYMQLPSRVEVFDPLASPSKRNKMKKRVSFSKRKLEHYFFNFEIISHLPVVSRVNPDLKPSLKKHIQNCELSGSQDLFSDSPDDTKCLTRPSDVQSCIDKLDSSNELFSQSPQHPNMEDFAAGSKSFTTLPGYNCNTKQSPAKGHLLNITSHGDPRHSFICAEESQNDCSFDLFLPASASESSKLSIPSVCTKEMKETSHTLKSFKETYRTNDTSFSSKEFCRTNYTAVSDKEINRINCSLVLARQINKSSDTPLSSREIYRTSYNPECTKEIDRTNNLSVLSLPAGDRTLDDCVSPDLFF